MGQDAFVALLERWERVRQLEDPEGYLYRTAMNLARNRRRAAARTFRRMLRLAPVQPDPLAHVEDEDVIARSISYLTRSQRIALVLVDLFLT
jgi:RNA polymerase sigma-70 factor, ECF subfamily